MLNLTAKSQEQSKTFGLKDFALYKGCKKDESGWNLKGRNAIIKIVKKKDEWWPRLTKEKVKNQKITVDWAKWIDEDE